MVSRLWTTVAGSKAPAVAIAPSIRVFTWAAVCAALTDNACSGCASPSSSVCPASVRVASGCCRPTISASIALGARVPRPLPVMGRSAAFDASETRCASTVKPWNRALTWAAVRVPA